MDVGVTRRGNSAAQPEGRPEAAGPRVCQGEMLLSIACPTAGRKVVRRVRQACGKTGHAGAGRTAPGWWLRGSGPGQRLQPGMHWQRSSTRTGMDWNELAGPDGVTGVMPGHCGSMSGLAGGPFGRERPADVACVSGPDALCGKGRVEARRRQAQHKKIPPAAKPGGEGWQGGSARYFSISAAGTYSRPKASATPLKVHLP